MKMPLTDTPRALFWHPDGWSDLGPEEQIGHYIAEGPVYPAATAAPPMAAPAGTEVVEICQFLHNGNLLPSEIDIRYNEQGRRMAISARVRVADSRAWAEAFNKAVDVWFALTQAEPKGLMAHVSDIAEWRTAAVNIVVPNPRTAFKLTTPDGKF